MKKRVDRVRELLRKKCPEWSRRFAAAVSLGGTGRPRFNRKEEAMEEEREVAGGGAPAEAEADPHRELCRILNLPEDAAPGVVSAALRGLAERAESGLSLIHI